jgi:probable F420-dependent oxidoreductase
VKLSVEFPSVVYREGPAKVLALAVAIEAIGYDDLAVFDYVVIGYPTQSRPAPPYPANSPILEALVTLSFVAAVTQHVTLSTEVLVLPQRQAVLVAKQAATLDTLSGGRLRLGVGVGWQQAEYDALGEQFGDRGRTMDEAIELLRACWGEDPIERIGQRFRADALAMEPKPPQRDQLPIWIGGGGSAALRRAARVGAGWMMPVTTDNDRVRAAIGEIRRQAEAAGRDPDAIQMQGMLAPPPTDAEGKAFYQNFDRVVRRAEEVQAMGFGWLAVNATALFQAGFRTVDQLTEALGTLHARLRAAVG